MRTSFHHQPEAQHPKSPAIHKLQADYPIYRGIADIERFSAGNDLQRLMWWTVPAPGNEVP